MPNEKKQYETSTPTPNSKIYILPPSTEPSELVSENHNNKLVLAAQESLTPNDKNNVSALCKSMGNMFASVRDNIARDGRQAMVRNDFGAVRSALGSLEENRKVLSQCPSPRPFTYHGELTSRKHEEAFKTFLNNNDGGGGCEPPPSPSP